MIKCLPIKDVAQTTRHNILINTRPEKVKNSTARGATNVTTIAKDVAQGNTQKGHDNKVFKQGLRGHVFLLPPPR